MVWGNGSILCKFIKGELQTDDKHVIIELVRRGYRNDGYDAETNNEAQEIVIPLERIPGADIDKIIADVTRKYATPNRTEKTRQELIYECKARNLKYDKRMNKTELIGLLEGG